MEGRSAGGSGLERRTLRLLRFCEVVAILGLDGLGHLGVQFAAKSGFKTIAIARGKDKEPLARKLGASQYIDWGHFPRIPFIMRYPRSAEGSQAQIRDHS